MVMKKSISERIHTIQICSLSLESCFSSKLNAITEMPSKNTLNNQPKFMC